MDELDFDFDTGEIIKTPEYDRVDFCAKIPGYWGVATITHWVKIPRSLVIDGPSRIRHINSGIYFPANTIIRTRTPWKGEPSLYFHESL